MRKQLRNYWEALVYFGIFLLLFIAPLLTGYVRTVTDANAEFRWGEIFGVWQILAVFLALFLIHNYLLAPLLVYKRRKVGYFLGTACLLVVFSVLACFHRPPHRPPHPDAPIHLSPAGEGHGASAPKFSHAEEKHRRPPHHRPPLMVGQGDVVGFILLFFMFGMNLGVKLYFKNERDRKEMEDLEKESLEHQLEYLKYQINPHFFMNTLNNIHALVDIDPEKAKTSIVVLSKMMRYILYEGNNKMIPLQRELDFISHYIALMRMRYTDKVKVQVGMPAGVTAGEVPPLLLITFVENAFKHGVSYQDESFINLSITVDEDRRLCFHCENSKKAAPQPGSSVQAEGGVGLANVRRRLDLIYQGQYTLDISETKDLYSVKLILPLSPLTPL